VKSQGLFRSYTWAEIKINGKRKVAVKKKYSFKFLRGLKQHTAFAQTLNDLRTATGQNGNACTDPIWFAVNSVDSRRRPWTVLLFEDGVLAGAVLLREQMRFRIPLGYFFACDAAGDEFVIAPSERRESTLRLCLEAMTARKPSAVIFLATLSDYGNAGWRELKRGSGEGTALYRLPIKSTWDETLQQFGSHTRRNLRYYSRNAQRYGAIFVPELTTAESREAAFQLQPKSYYPIPARGIEAIERAIERVDGGFAAGLKSPTGEWLSFLTGWRSGGKTSVFFQMNHLDFRKASISTAMRALLIQHEIERGTSDVVFVSYTSEVIERGCANDIRHDLLIAKPSWRLMLITWFASRHLPVEHRLRQCVEAGQRNPRGGAGKLGNVRSGL
jgi:hypothetical protein